MIRELEDEIKFIRKTYLASYTRNPSEVPIAKQWIIALKRDIEGLKSGKYTYTKRDYAEAVQFESDHEKEAIEAFENLTGADYNDLSWAEKIDIFEMMKND